MAIEYFCAYHSFLKAIEPLNDAEIGRLFRACLIYSKTGEAPEIRGNEKFVFPLIREQIDRDREKYISQCSRNRENVKKRWENDIPPNTTVYDRIRDDTTDTKTKAKTKTKTKAKTKAKTKESVPPFIPPTLEEVREYCVERQNNVNAEKFWNYYSSADWTDSNGKPVMNWKLKLITWENTDNRRGGANDTGSRHTGDGTAQRRYDITYD